MIKKVDLNNKNRPDVNNQTNISPKPPNNLTKIRNYASKNPVSFLLLLLMLPLTLLAVQQTINYLSKAQTPPPSFLSFSPNVLDLPPDGTVKIMLDSQSFQVAFARVVFNFDNSKINLTGSVPTNPNLSTVVEKTDLASANSQGKMIIVIAASPADTQPQGNIEFASLTFTTIIQTPDSTTTSFDAADIQIIESSGIELIPSATSATFSLNGGPLVSDTPVPTGITNTPVPPTNTPGPTIPPQACSDIGSQLCYEQWKREYTGIDSTLYADLSNDGTTDLIDFEYWRRAVYP